MSIIKFNAFLFAILSWYNQTAAFPFFPFLSQPQKTITIMLDPAGDAQHIGRLLGDSLERAVTQQFVTALQERLENKYPHVRIVLTRQPGQTLQPLQNANFANRLHVDLYLSINFYQEHSQKPVLYLYNFSYNDDFITKKFDLAFCTYDQAHLQSYSTTTAYGAMVKEYLDTQNKFAVKGLYKLPFKPLIGITSPALAFEAGLKHKEDWVYFVEPIAQSLDAIIKKMVQS